MLRKLFVVLFTCFAFCSNVFAVVDLNSATQPQLEAIKGLGPTKAKAIVEYRAKNGSFKTVEDVMKVPGIKQGVFNKIKTEVSVNGKQSATPTKTSTTTAKK
ncbi:MAG: ComEA family DNA-binding protein [Formivibrio sp.]|nr:ComEA family DNA-binding protein [Formivibrio sp.]